jgi:putative DNA-binding protein
MPSLRELQRSFGAFLLDARRDAPCVHIVDDGFTAAERCGIYRNGCRSTLIAALRLAYPAVDRLVGAEFFDAAAGEFALAHPPTSGYLNEYGAGFADFLPGFEPAAPLFYLPDVARFEWALGAAANAPDAPFLEPGALAAVEAADHAALRFEPHPSLRLLLLSFPADRIADAVLAGDEATMARIDFSDGPVAVLVHRGRDGVEAHRLGTRAYDFVSRLCAGETLGALVEAVDADAPALLAEQLAKGRLTAFRIEP